TDVVAVSAGHFNFSLALRRDGTVWAWGANEHGQLGDESPFPRRSPAPVMGVTHAVAVAAGRVGSLVLRKDGTLWAWGTDLNGTLGTGTSIVGPRPPSPVLGLSSTAAISAGASHSLALRGDGTVWSWGDNSNGQLSVGNGSLMDRYAPVRVVGVTDIQALFSSPTANHTLALRGDGTVWAWGENMFGQLGDGEWGFINVPPARVAGLTDVKRLAAGQFNSLALRGDGTVWTWGYNMVGFFPNDPMNQFHAPVQVQGLGDVVDVATSGRHALAVREDGTVWAWGGNGFGQLGNGNVGGLNPTPGQVSGLTDVVSIVAGEFFSVAMRRDGTVWTWGTRRIATNQVLELQRTPVRLEGVTDVVAVALGRFHGLALRADGTTVGWGSNSEGQLANGESPQHLTPARVLLPCRFTGMPSRGHRASEQEHCPAAP
ncbi:MAG TPA: RCC1 repeat-containing protein, partial [Myxococcaceae bacterium]|nr:RCC1 repeat-containing protein [Myxococcaceae bacterium]